MNNRGSAFYNTYRPKQFAEVLGQAHATEILKKQAILKAFGHAYLFYGPSGTGKTTTARLLAMALNCANMNGTGEPCGECQSCKAIQESAYWDLIELDGARFSRIEDARELVYKASFAPFNGTRKVILIDECHRLSEASWDVLLKTLEEPPPHLVIILCSTDAGKIPLTVKSRCQLYPFHQITPKHIKQKLTGIIADWGITLDGKALDFIVESAAGNMRSAENMIEQVTILKA